MSRARNESSQQTVTVIARFCLSIDFESRISESRRTGRNQSEHTHHFSNENMDLSETPKFFSTVWNQAKRLWPTYKWASHLAHFEDINLVPEPILRCRYFAIVAMVVVLVTSSVFLLSLDLNVLDTTHATIGYRGIGQMAKGVAEDWASAMPHVTINTLSISRQTAAAGLAFVFSSLAYGVLVFLGVWRRSVTATRRQQLIFSSFLVSLGLLRYSLVTIPVAVVVLVIRNLGFDPSSSVLASFGVLVGSYVATAAWTQLANRRGPHSSTTTSRNDDAPLIYSSLAPIVVCFVLLSTASWVGDRFKPNILLQTSDACGAPDKGTCALYIRPRDIDGTIFLDRVSFVMLTTVDETKDIVGPRYTAVATGSFRVIASPDEPFPVQVGSEATRGVIGYTEFNCPRHAKRKNGHLPKIRVISYTASAIPKTMSDAEPGRREPTEVAFDSKLDVELVFRNVASECSLFP